MTAMKKAEDGDALIVRFYEWAGKEGDVTLQLPAAAEQASDTDLMERTTGALSPQGNSVTVHTKPYEIKTVRIQLAPNPGAASAQVHR